jgi:shikimate kinase / 3-dehydroquinate synthase
MPEGRAPPDGLVLIGASGSGKSLVGRLVAERLGRPFVDTDEVVHRLAGEPVHEIIRSRGEAAFRELERRAVEEACAEQGTVIAAGGGAVIDPLSRWQLWAHGLVFWLQAPIPALVGRLMTDPLPRPLIEADPASRLERMGAERAPFYRAADVHVDASPVAGVVAEAILARVAEGPSPWPPPGRRLFDALVRRQHPLGPPLGRVIYGYGLDRQAVATGLEGLIDPPPSVIVDRVVANRVPDLLSRLPSGRRLEVTAGESAKRLRRVEELIEWLAAGEAERGAALIAVGGGTIGDLAGTAAALYARGVPLVQVPTTWLAQSDSAIGGKVAVDLSVSKNAAGAFWPPAAIVADTSLLRLMPLARRRDGMAESIKAALVGDPGLWHLIDERGESSLQEDVMARYAILERSARVKMAICERDPFDTGERRSLNLGHTIGHALEVESAYRLSHGMAVALGLRAVAAIAMRRGAVADLAESLDALLAKLRFQLHRSFDGSRVRDALRLDKKRHRGRQRWILPMAIGQVAEVDDVTDRELDLAIDTIAA